MWKNALEHVWNTRPIEHTQKLIDRMPKVVEAIIQAEGENKYILNLELNWKFHLTMITFANLETSVL